ncbi:hypothetical protein FBU30_002433 [Linnemannia zychae]|nr:hypothetical protein FBU30_002433 [Linnemannia zychae]
MTVIYKFVLLASAALAITAAPVNMPTRLSTAVSMDHARNFVNNTSFAPAPKVHSRAVNNSEDNSNTGDASPFNGNSTTPSNGNSTIPSSPTEDSDISVRIAATSGQFSGKGTWFTDSTGSCGVPFDTNDMIVAMNAAQMGGTAQCGKTVKISYGGKTTTAKVVDTCPSQYCSSGSLDLSQAAFQELAPLSVGVIDITWEFA